MLQMPQIVKLRQQQAAILELLPLTWSSQSGVLPSETEEEQRAALKSGPVNQL